MFGFDVKEVFKERIYEIVFVLCSIHLGAVIISYLLKWIQAYLNSCLITHNNREKVGSNNKCLQDDLIQSLFNNKFTKKENIVTLKNCNESNNKISKDDCTSIIKYLETCVDVSCIPQEILRNLYNNVNVLNELALEIDDAINTRKLISDSLKKTESTSEAQTNITISPTFKTYCSSPNLILSCQSKSCDIPLHISESSDSFESVCSTHSKSEISKFMPINSLVVLDKITNQNENINIYKTERVKHGAFFNVNSSRSNKKRLKTHLQSLQINNHNDYEKQVSQENEILELAINELENELKPIKDQIKVLKDCLHNFDCFESDDNSFVSELSSSVSDAITQSECYSEEISTTYAPDMKSFSSKHCKILDKKFSPLKAKIQFNGSKPNLEKETNSKSYKILQCVNKFNSKRPKDICILEFGQPLNGVNDLNKLSPIADMYIKLSHCSSHTANFGKNNNYKQMNSDESVTCHINLNLSLGAITLSSTSRPKENWIKDCKMQPVLSEPEDILVKM